MSDVLIHVRDDRAAVMRYVDIGNGAHAPVMALIDAGFFAGREAYTFYEFSIPTGQSVAIKVVSPTDTLVTSFSVELDLASIRLELVAGGTEGGSFATSLPVLKSNTMSTAPAYNPQVTMAVGGTHTGGTVVDVLTAVSGANPNKAVASTASEEHPVGFPAGTYYVRIANTDGATATGIFRARWQEQP